MRSVLPPASSLFKPSDFTSPFSSAKPVGLPKTGISPAGLNFFKHYRKHKLKQSFKSSSSHSFLHVLTHFFFRSSHLAVKKTHSNTKIKTIEVFMSQISQILL